MESLSICSFAGMFIKNPAVIMAIRLAPTTQRVYVAHIQNYAIMTCRFKRCELMPSHSQTVPSPDYTWTYNIEAQKEAAASSFFFLLCNEIHSRSKISRSLHAWQVTYRSALFWMAMKRRETPPVTTNSRSPKVELTLGL